MLEQFLDMKDVQGTRPWELLPVLPPGHHVYDNSDAIFRPVLELENGSSRTPSSAGSDHGEGGEEEGEGGEREKKSAADNEAGTTDATTAQGDGTDANVRPLSRANLDAHTRAQTPHTPHTATTGGVLDEGKEMFPDGPLISTTVPAHLRPGTAD